MEAQREETTPMWSEVEESDVRQLSEKLRGELVRPEDPAYEVARRVYNAMIDKHPMLIARCVDAADVIASVNFARENNLLLAVRGGAHNVAGFGTCDGGMVIDLSMMRGVRVDLQKQTVRAGGGCTWGDVDHATHVFGMAVPGGFVSTTGIAGLTLGGGVGHLTRKCGLTSDTLLSADVVTADGRLVTASEGENQDLFWALRGGGGNFGVVTSFEYRMSPVKDVVGGALFYPIEKAEAMMKFYLDYIENAPEDMSAFFGFHQGARAPFVPTHLQGAPVCMIAACYAGPLDQADEVVKPLREFEPPLLDLMTQMPYPSLTSMFDPLLPPGQHHYWKADFVNEVTDELIDVHLKYGPQVPTWQSLVHLYPMDGAAHRVGPKDQAFNRRDAKFNCVIVGISPEGKETAQCTQWVRDYWAAAHPYSSGAAYVNFLMDEGVDRIRASYGDNYDRLVEVKNKYDPGNLFRVNQNIHPTGK